MKTAVDISEDFSDIIFEALIRSTAVREAVPAGDKAWRRRHVIDSAGFDADGSLMFDGEFDFHHGLDGDEGGHPALRSHVTGLLVQDSQKRWIVQRLSVESLETVDAGLGPDELA
ncbi:hypothetical protein GT347_00155 [Xylophilus rhododendri]|uniref:Uncharacterized protein n=1 Tax=Xylophilus rhododendri TaxID=2697032 RepID=A0A857IYM2_9BURK|nr:hypothetical protein [Xylophilus rhododendri]QHI96546.1 hypothetical protein GT347_00155 [Xylophilus rhododendri]